MFLNLFLSCNSGSYISIRGLQVLQSYSPLQDFDANHTDRRTRILRCPRDHQERHHDLRPQIRTDLLSLLAENILLETACSEES